MDERIEVLERQFRVLVGRLERLERPVAATQAERIERLERPVAATQAERIERFEQPAAAAAAVAPLPERPAAAGKAAPFASANFEDLLGGRVLAWVGGFTVLMGVALLFALAVAQGWIGEGARTLLAAGGSLALLAAGVFLHERRGRTDAARAAIATAVAALFATVTVAAQVYEILSAPLAFLLAALVGTTGTWLALRYDARGIAALGTLGTVGAPLLVDAPRSLGTLALLFVAVAAGVGVLLHRRWTWLAVAVVVLGALQWIAGVLGTDSLAVALVVLVVFGGLGSLAAVAFELRDPDADLRRPAASLLTFQALAVATTGWVTLGLGLGHPGLADAWVALVAAAHLALGLLGMRSSRVSRDLSLLGLAIGVLLGDLAFGLLAEGPLLALGWAASAVLFAGLLRRNAGGPRDGMLAGAGLGGHVALSLGHVLLGDAPPTALLGDSVDLAPALIALAGLAAGCFASARFAADADPRWRMSLDVLGLAAVAYSAALALDGLALVAAWTIEAVVLTGLAARGEQRVAGVAGLVHLVAAAAHVLLFEAPLAALYSGLPDAGTALAALVMLSAAAVAGGRLLPEWRRLGHGTAAVAALFLVSTLLVSAFQPGQAEAALLDLGARQQGQALLSALWALTGVGAVVLGLRRDLRPVRLAGLGLLLVTVAKVFVYDLAALTSFYRVASVVALGLLLLVGAYAWQRARPRAPEDLRRVPAALR